MTGIHRFISLFEGQYSPNSYARQRIPIHIRKIFSILSSYINIEAQEDIYATMLNFENKGRIIHEFKYRKLDIYFQNIVLGRTIFEKLTKEGLEQKKQLSFLSTLFVFTEYFEKTKSKRIYALLGYIYYLDYNLSSFHLAASRVSPGDDHYIKKLLLLWTLINEKIITNIAEDIIYLAQSKITGQVEIDSRDKWESKGDETKKDKIDVQERIQIDGLTYSWSEEWTCSFFVSISEFKDKHGNNPKRFDGILILMPDIQNLKDILSEPGRKIWKKDSELVDKRLSFLINLVRHRLSSGEKFSELFAKPLLGVSIIEQSILISYKINTAIRILLSIFLGKERLLPENPFRMIDIKPFELKRINSGLDRNQEQEVEKIKQKIINRIEKQIRNAINKLKSCGVPSKLSRL